MKVAIKIIIYYLFISFIMIVPTFHMVSSEQFSGLLYMNYSVFDSLHIEQFDVQFMIMFILLFFILYFQQVSILNENISYLSMAIYRENKKNIIKRLAFMQFKSITFIFLLNILCYSILSTLVVGKFDLVSILPTWVYLAKYCMTLFFISLLSRILSLIRTMPLEIMITLFVFILTMVNDVVFNIHIITFSNVMNYELVSLVFVLVIGCIGLLIFSIIFEKRGNEL